MSAMNASPVAVADRFGQRFTDGAIVIAVGIAIWQLLYELVGSVGMSPPLATTVNAFSLVTSAEFWPNAAATFYPFFLTLVIETVAGLLLGLIFGLHRLSGDVAAPILAGLYSVPKIVFYPIILLSFGIGIASEVAFSMMNGILPIILFTMGAVRLIRPVYFKTARTLHLTLTQTLWHVALPAVLPEVFSGLRIGFSATLLGVLLCEMFGSKNGLGFLLMNAIGGSRVDETMSLTLLLAGTAGVMNLALLAIDRRLHQRA